MKLYFDGALIASNEYSGSFSAIKNGARFRLGRSVVDNEPFVDGQLAEVRIWKVGRTEAQVRQTMNQRLIGGEAGLAALWNFEKVENGVVKDSGPGAHHGNLIGGAKLMEADNPPWTSAVRSSNVLELDGNGSYVELPADAFTNLTEVTVEGWVRWESFKAMSRFFDFTFAGYELDAQNRETSTTLWIELQYEPVCVERLVEEIQKLFSIKAGEKGVGLFAETDSNSPPGLLLDEVRLRQVLFNVVGNALKFTEKGQVKIRAWSEYVAAGVSPAVEPGVPPGGNDAAGSRAFAEQTSDPDGRMPPSTPGETPAATDPDETRVNLFLEIEDTGIGIPPDQLETIFGAFSQVSGQSTRKFGGTGLGLTITKRLTEMMHGVITVRSELGKGSAFRFVFPNVAITEWAEMGPVTGGAGGDFSQFAPAAILVADDVALNRALLTGYFEGTGHKVITATNGREALEQAERHLPDIILMDMRMPELNGYEATARLKANPALKHIPVIAVTASSFREEEARARQVCEGFVRKPFNRADLIAELQRFLKPAQPRDPASAAASQEATLVAPPAPVPAEALAKRPELLARLREEQTARWPRLCQTMAIGELEEFAARLAAVAEEGGWPDLRSFAFTLRQQAEDFDLDRLPQTLKRFPEICQQLANR